MTYHILYTMLCVCLVASGEEYKPVSLYELDGEEGTFVNTVTSSPTVARNS